MRPPLNLMVLRKRSEGHPQPRVGTYSRFARVHKAHAGWDLLASEGTAVFAITDGWAESGQSESYGRYVRLRFWYPPHQRVYWALYAHLSAASVSAAGCWVGEGIKLGRTGTTGKSAKGLQPREAHLHFEVSFMKPGFKTKYWSRREKLIDQRGTEFKLWGTIDPANILGHISPILSVETGRPADGSRYTLEASMTSWNWSRFPPLARARNEEYQPALGVHMPKSSDWLNQSPHSSESDPFMPYPDPRFRWPQL